jgi:hypothetical protein
MPVMPPPLYASPTTPPSGAAAAATAVATSVAPVTVRMCLSITSTPLLYCALAVVATNANAIHKTKRGWAR